MSSENLSGTPEDLDEVIRNLEASRHYFQTQGRLMYLAGLECANMLKYYLREYIKLDMDLQEAYRAREALEND